MRARSMLRSGRRRERVGAHLPVVPVAAVVPVVAVARAVEAVHTDRWRIGWNDIGRFFELHGAGRRETSHHDGGSERRL